MLTLTTARPADAGIVPFPHYSRPDLPAWADDQRPAVRFAVRFAAKRADYHACTARFAEADAVFRRLVPGGVLPRELLDDWRAGWCDDLFAGRPDLPDSADGPDLLAADLRAVAEALHLARCEYLLSRQPPRVWAFPDPGSPSSLPFRRWLVPPDWFARWRRGQITPNTPLYGLGDILGLNDRGLVRAGALQRDHCLTFSAARLHARGDPSRDEIAAFVGLAYCLEQRPIPPAGVLPPAAAWVIRTLRLGVSELANRTCRPPAGVESPSLTPAEVAERVLGWLHKVGLGGRPDPQADEVPPKVPVAEQPALAMAMLTDPKVTIKAIAERLGIDRTTLYKASRFERFREAATRMGKMGSKGAGAGGHRATGYRTADGVEATTDRLPARPRTGRRSRD